MTGVKNRSQATILARRGLKPKQSAWRDQIRTAFRDPAELLAHLDLAPDGSRFPSKPPFPMLVPRAFAGRMEPGNPRDPLLLQVLPDYRETETVSGFVSDPVGDNASRKVRGLLHKYAGRALLITTGACAVHCRYCFRQAFPYATDHAGPGQSDTAIDYIASRPDIEEVILSGGDPLMLSTDQLQKLSDQLRSIKHIRRLRLHTRLPVVLPDRITTRFCEWIDSLPWPVVVVIHANHAREFDDQVDQAMVRLRRAGAHLLNQSVLLAGINDNTEALVALMRRSFSAHVLPYYLHLLDRVAGAARFESDQQHALTLHDAMRVQLSGYLVPRLVREKAGAPYKLPVL
jgi:EF-P beta-lysylation protein EpmB